MVLLDLVMPVMDGFVLMEILKEKGVLEHLPVVVITVDGSEQILEKAYSMGAEEIIIKPFNPDIIREKVKNILSMYIRMELISSMGKLQHLTEEDTEDQLSADTGTKHGSMPFLLGRCISLSWRGKRTGCWQISPGILCLIMM